MNFHERASRALALSGEDAVLCARSAAYLHHLDRREPDIIDVSIPWRRRPAEHDDVRVRRTRAEGRRPAVRDPLPHTDVVDTVLDLGDHTDAETCVYWLTEATRRGLTTMVEVEAALTERNRHRHRVLIREIAEDIDSGATSNLEVRYVRHVERAHELPQAVRQLIVPETGHRADFAYPAARLLIEVDGLAYHSGPARERDAALDAEHAAAGWVTRRYTWGPVVGASCVVAYEVARLLRAGGLHIRATPCARERAAQA